MSSVERSESLLEYHQGQENDENNQIKPSPLSAGSESEPSRSMFSIWFNECAWHGMGLFGESYLIFSIGTLKPIWQELFPDCFDGIDCSGPLLQSLTYSVVLGVILGMLVIGKLSNSLGRRTGSILTASIMAGGAIGLTLVSWILASNPPLLFASTSVFLFLFGIGVGGEYPLSASSASERAMGDMSQRMKMELEKEAQRKQSGYERGELPPLDNIKFHVDSRDSYDLPKPRKRGQMVQLVFTMQGMGIMVNSLILTFLLMVTGQFGHQGMSYSSQALLTVWRLTYAFGAVILCYVLVSRIRCLNESSVWQDDKTRRDALERNTLVPLVTPQIESKNAPYLLNETATSVSSLSAPSVLDDPVSLRHVPSTTAEEDLKSSKRDLLLRNYGLRLFGTSASWLLWDIAFYGNKLFQSSFIVALTGAESTLLEISFASTVNALFALLGYFAAAAIIDDPRVGRLRLQQYGFLLTGSLFVGCGFLYDKLSSTSLIIMYLGSSFVGQCGPNATTFLIPAEIFPTEMRTMCHGIAAASGKVGALIAAILFHHLSEVDMFLLSGYASFAACIVTIWTIPETTSLDLYETDRKWRMILEGRKGEYEGAANSPEYLSLFERSKLRRKQFQAALNEHVV